MFGNHTLTDVTARRDEMVASGMQGHRDFRVIDAAASGHKIGGGWNGIKGRILDREAANEPEYVMTPDDHTLVRGLSTRKMYMSQYYWANRPGAANRLDRLFQSYGRTQKLMRQDVEYIKGQFKGVVAEWDEKKFSDGGLAKYRGVVCMTVSDYKFDAYGNIVVDVLIDGTVTPKKTSELSVAVRTRKKKIVADSDLA